MDKCYFEMLLMYAHDNGKMKQPVEKVVKDFQKDSLSSWEEVDLSGLK